MSLCFEADWTWTGKRFEEGMRLQIDSQGRIESLSKSDGNSSVGIQRLKGRALLPGFINAHSHAFQRGLRGFGERFPKGAGSFWSWREAMYAQVEGLNYERIFEISKHCFSEMLRAGITQVGEFHYLHHAKGRDWALDAAILEAAQEVGIRLRLLLVYYQRGAIGESLKGAQKRFDGGAPDEYWRAFDRLLKELDPKTQSLGCVVHSIRAASLEDMVLMHEEARRRVIPFHMHIEEQRLEIEQCLAAYGQTPMGILLERLEIDELFTAVHCTHTQEEEFEAFLQRGGNACICPLTEANLGDGIPPSKALLRHRDRESVCLGTDSNARISFLEEMRWLEYTQRLASETRGAFVDEEGTNANRLVSIATEGGARALQSDAGVLRPKAPADFITVATDSLELSHSNSGAALAESLLFGGGNRSLRESYVAGERVV